MEVASDQVNPTEWQLALGPHASTCAAISTIPPPTSGSAACSAELETEQQTGGNCIFYLATPPGAFAVIVAPARRGRPDARGRPLAARGRREAVRHRSRLRRKPSTATCSAVVEEQQIYRIDHYLGKETVQNIMVLRFANGLFEPLWNRDHIDHVQITVAETVGVEHRGKFYDATGALRDMVPNHLFQLLDADRDGAADLLRGRRRAHGEGQGAGRRAALPCG